MERAGMHSTVVGAQAMLDLRSMWISGQWKAFQQERVQREPNGYIHTATWLRAKHSSPWQHSGLAVAPSAGSHNLLMIGSPGSGETMYDGPIMAKLL